MHASAKCDRTPVSRELFARHCNYVLLSCHLVSVQGLCIAGSDSMQDCNSAAHPSLSTEKGDQCIFYVAFPGADLNPHRRDGLGLSSAFRPTFARSQCI